MQLSKPLSELLAPLFEALPFEQAMPELVPKRAPDSKLVDIVQKLIKDPVVQVRPSLQAGLWLYVDDLHRSHEISQSIETPTGALWHGIMHRREGDFWNSKYWFRKAGPKHALAAMDPGAFVDQVEQTYRNNPPEFLAQQRKEWQTLFEWCAKEEAK